jgi:TolB protein
MKRLCAAALLFALAFSAPEARADTHLVVPGTQTKPLPIAIPPFVGHTGDDNALGVNMTQVISADLAGSGLFHPLDPRSFIQDAASAAASPNYAEWKSVGAQGLVTGLLSKTSDGRTRVEFRLWDIYNQSQMIGTAYMTTPSNWRRIAHIISDVIYKRMTGENGYFDSRIVYISETGPADARIKRLAIMDQDGANHRYLTDGDTLVLTPRFSPTRQQITYMAYYNKRPRVYIYDINSGSQHVLGDFPGMTFAPRFSPDGNRVVMSLSKGGNSDIFTMDIHSHGANRLTNDNSINTSPSYSPDGRQIAFESDRSGKQQIYVMNADGSGTHRITFSEGRYANPVWSPRGDYIAFTKILGGQFYIGLIHPDGSGEREIVGAFDVEGPTWSPNGRVLAYFKENPTGFRRDGRSARIYTIDATGFNERQEPTPLDGSDPAWSPLNAQ